MRLVLGNRHATDSSDNGKTRVELPKGKRAAVLDIPDEMGLSAAFVGITAVGGVWEAHTHQVQGQTPAPAWVASNNAPLATLIAAHFGGIEIRDLEEN